MAFSPWNTPTSLPTPKYILDFNKGLGSGKVNLVF